MNYDNDILSNYDHSHEYSKFYKVYKNRNCGIIEKASNKLLIEVDFIEITFVDNLEIFFCKNNFQKSESYNCYNKNGEFLKELKYSHIWFDYFRDNNFLLVATDFDSYNYNFEANEDIKTNYGVINKALDLIVPIEYGKIELYNNLFLLYNSEKSEKTEIEDEKFSSVVSHHSILGGKWGISDSKHNILIPFIYDWIDFIQNKDIFLVNNGGIMTYLEQLGDGRGYWWIEGGKWGIINSNNEILVPVIYSKINRYEDKVIFQNTLNDESIDLNKTHFTFKI